MEAMDSIGLGIHEQKTSYCVKGSDAPLALKKQFPRCARYFGIATRLSGVERQRYTWRTSPSRATISYSTGLTKKPSSRRDNESGDDDDCKRLLRIAADSGGQCRRQKSEARNQCGHHDGPQSQQ